MNLIDLKERIVLASQPPELGGSGATFTQEERNFLLHAINTAPPPSSVLSYMPGNNLGRLDAIWVALSVDDGGEGICAAPINGMTMPLVVAERRLVDKLIIPAARLLSKMSGKVVRITKFKNREDGEIIRP